MAGRGCLVRLGGEEGREEPGQPVNRTQQDGGEKEGKQQGSHTVQAQFGGDGHCGGGVSLVGLRVSLDPGSLPGGPGQEPPKPGLQLLSHPGVKERRAGNLMAFLSIVGVTVCVCDLVAVGVLGTGGGSYLLQLRWRQG